MAFFSYIKKMDWWMAGSAIVLSIFGLMSIFSYCFAKQDFAYIEKQAIFFAVGILAMLLISLFDYRILRNNSYLILIFYFVCLFLLAGLFLFAPEIRGTRGWYKFGFLSLDPIEPAKLVLIIILAKYFSMRHVEMYKFRHIIFSGLYAFFFCAIVFFKPDLGGTALLFLIWLGILLISGIKINHFLILLLCFLLIVGISWQFVLKDYQKARIISFIFPYDVLGGSWSQNQAKIAIGSGNIFGKGLFQNSQVQYGFLPEPHTDFIISAIAEEWGMLGTIVVFLCYVILIWRIIKTAAMSQSNFPRLFASGFAVLLTSQFFINVGMNLGILPVVGIYLPFISYGGSGLIANFLGLGILQSIKTRR